MERLADDLLLAPPLTTRPFALALCALASLALALLAALAAHWRHAVPAPERALQARAAEARLKAARLSKVAHFVEVSLLEREGIKLDKELARERAARLARAASGAGAAGAAGAAERLLRPAALLALAAAFWGAPLAEGLPARALGPGVGALLAFPGLPRGSLGVLAWLGVCHVVASRAAAAAAAALGLATKAEGEGEGGGALGMLSRFLR
jgi:hypothetical protein